MKAGSAISGRICAEDAEDIGRSLKVIRLMSVPPRARMPG
jgi:hypothetical protein